MALPRISNAEYEKRLNSFKELMAKHNLDFVVGFSNILDPSTVRYFSDFSAVNESSAVIIPLEGNQLFVVGKREWTTRKLKTECRTLKSLLSLK